MWFLENLFSLTDFSSFFLFKAFDNNAWDRNLRVISHVSSRIGTLNWHNSVADPSRPGGGGGGPKFFSVYSKNKGAPRPPPPPKNFFRFRLKIRGPPGTPVLINKMNKPAVTQPLSVQTQICVVKSHNGTERAVSLWLLVWFIHFVVANSSTTLSLTSNSVMSLDAWVTTLG